MGNSIKQLAEKYYNTLNFNDQFTLINSEQYRELERIYRILNVIIELNLVDCIENKILQEDKQWETQ